MRKVPSTAKISCPVWQNTICGVRSKEYDRENIVLTFGSTNLLRDVKKVYRDTFSEALEQYNRK